MSAPLAVTVLAQEAPVHSPEVLRACGDTPSWLCEVVFDVTGSERTSTIVDWVVAKPLKIVLIIGLAWVVNRLARRGIKRFVRSFEDPDLRSRTVGRMRDRAPAALIDTGPVNMRSGQRARTIGAVLRSVTSVFVWTIATLMVLAEFDVNLGPLIAGAGIAGVALGFGAQSLVKDFLSGIFMLMEDQFGVGDVIDVGEASGVVEGVSLRTTRLRDVEGTVWHVPNGEIRRVGNKSQEWSRALLDVDVAYGSDLPAAMEVIKAAADELCADDEWRTSILDPPEMWGVERFGPDGVTIRLVVRTRPADQWAVLRALRQRLKAALDAAGIEIPFPQRTVWVRPQGATLPGAEVGAAGDGPGAGGAAPLPPG